MPSASSSSQTRSPTPADPDPVPGAAPVPDPRAVFRRDVHRPAEVAAVGGGGAGAEALPGGLSGRDRGSGRLSTFPVDAVGEANRGSPAPARGRAPRGATPPLRQGRRIPEEERRVQGIHLISPGRRGRHGRRREAVTSMTVGVSSNSGPTGMVAGLRSSGGRTDSPANSSSGTGEWSLASHSSGRAGRGCFLGGGGPAGRSGCRWRSAPPEVPARSGRGGVAREDLFRMGRVGGTGATGARRGASS